MVMVDWCALPKGMEALIARRIPLIEDFIAFRATCTSWREGTTLLDFYTSAASCPKLPLLMVSKLEMYDDDDEDDEYKLVSVEISQPEGGYQRVGPEELAKIRSEQLSASRSLRSNYLMRHPVDERQFLSLSKGKTCKFSFPEIKGMESRGSKGWLTMVKRSSGDMCLFHPISRVHIPLPKIPIRIRGWKILPKNFITAVLSARPSETSDYVLMAVFMEEIYTSPGSCELRTYTGFWKPGNLTWTEVDTPCWVENLNYYNGKFYALSSLVEVWMLDVSGIDPTVRKIVKVPGKPYRPCAQLVECGGRLLMIAPYYQYHPDMSYEHDLEMVEIDVIKGSCKFITSLGSSSVFLGRREGFSIDGNKFPGIIQPNSIYFSDGKHQVATPGPYDDEHYADGVWLNF